MRASINLDLRPEQRHSRLILCLTEIPLAGKAVFYNILIIMHKQGGRC